MDENQGRTWRKTRMWKGFLLICLVFLSVKFEGRNNNGWIKISEKLR